MTTRMQRRGCWRVLAVVVGMLPAGCGTGYTPPPPSCKALEQTLIGTWVGVPPIEGLPAEKITLSADYVYSSTYEGFSASEVGIWGLGYAPDNSYCDILFVGDSNGVIHTTYSLRMDGDYMVLDSWGSGETCYYREGTPPPPSAE